MNKIRVYLKAYHPVVHILLVGTVFISLTSSMSVPFLVIFLSETTDIHFAFIGVIIGVGELAAAFGGFIGGVLSDFLGRRKLMIYSLIIQSLVFIGFIYNKNPLFLLILSTVSGLSTSFFVTISKALMGDLTPKKLRFRVFSNRYLAVNLGYSIGPMLGSWLGLGGSAFAFLLTSCTYMLYAISLIFIFRKWRSKASIRSEEEKVNIVQAWNILRGDRVLFLFILGGILLTTVHGQMSVPLSEYLKENIAKGVELFGLLMSVNGMTVLLFQVHLTRWSERYSLFQRIAMGSGLFVIGELGFAFSAGWFGFIIAMFIFTVGEILIVPAEYAQIDQITPHGMRGTYYGAQNFSALGNFVGPWLSGLLLSSYGGRIMFIFMGIISVASLFFYWKGKQLYSKRTSAQLVSQSMSTK